MAVVQVILHGMGASVHDTDNYPIVLQFNDDKSFFTAAWIVPSFPGYIPTDMLSEIRVQEGALQVYVDGPDGFQSGPHPASWIRSEYPRGKYCSFLEVQSGKLKGVSVEIVEGSLVVGDLPTLG